MIFNSVISSGGGACFEDVTSSFEWGGGVAIDEGALRIEAAFTDDGFVTVRGIDLDNLASYDTGDGTLCTSDTRFIPHPSLSDGAGTYYSLMIEMVKQDDELSLYSTDDITVADDEIYFYWSAVSYGETGSYFYSCYPMATS